ncbi:hypothetical protein [Amycolatopsis thermoflava]|uniref:hypothetical protein n=1 Tax=Amycolatopsis thermoflava TaxID=84480 RepID=UPI00381BDA0A
MTDQQTTAPTEIVIDVDRALQLLREVVAERGADTVYQPVRLGASRPDRAPLPNCVYAHNGAPSCLVGHALHRAGVPVEDLAKMTGQIDELSWWPESLDVGSDAVEVFLAAQYAQDEGSPWGDALAAAEHEAGVYS